eukprot:s4485_g1.t1
MPRIEVGQTPRVAPLPLRAPCVGLQYASVSRLVRSGRQETWELNRPDQTTCRLSELARLLWWAQVGLRLEVGQIPPVAAGHRRHTDQMLHNTEFECSFSDIVSLRG